MGKKILVTGAGGFIGTALLSCLAQKKGVTVLGLGRRKMPAGDLHYQQVDLLNREKLRGILKKERPGLIFHLAGGRSGALTELFRDNISTTVNLFEAISSLRDYHPRVLITGSAAEYGETPGPRHLILESGSTHPSGLYGWVKLFQTQTALHYAGLGVDVVIARLFNILGPGIPENMAAGRFARQLVLLDKVSRSKVLHTASLEGIRDFLDIRDICEALFILSSRGKKGEIYNICSQKGIVMRQLLKAMIIASGQKGIKAEEHKKNGPGALFAVGSNKKLKKITGWKPQYGLPQSIRDTLAFYLQDKRFA